MNSFAVLLAFNLHLRQFNNKINSTSYQKLKKITSPFNKTKMKQTILTILSLLISITCFCQATKDTSKFNFDFEKVNNNLPINWECFGSKDYTLSIDTIIKKTGKNSAAIEYNGTALDFRAWAYTIPASYEGKKITLSGFIKTENVSDGWAGLWMRIDPKIAFDNMQKRGIKGTTDWQKYEITLELNPLKTKQIVVGGLIAGKGKMWIDDLHVSIDGKDIKELKPIIKKESEANKDKEFDSGSKISLVNLTEAKTEDLVILGKVWGFLKYYHPGIAKGNNNWDYELFRILPKILAANDQLERNNVLLSWVTSFGNVETGKEKKNKNEVKIYPDLTWMNNSILGNELTLQLNSIKNAKRYGTNYYVELVDGVGNPEFTNENPYSSMKYPDTGFRLLSLYRYWNIIQYYYPYKNLIEENWNDVLKEFVPKIITVSNELEYKQTVLSLIARIHDTHANIWGQDEALKNYRGLNYAPFEITFIENKAVVTDYYDKVLGEKSGLNIGDVIEAINDRSVDEIIKEKLPFTPASNYPTQLREISENLLRTNDSSLVISFSKGDIKLTKEIECFAGDVMNIYGKYQRKDTCFRMINSDISYIYPGTIKDEDLPKIMPEVLKTKGLIIDFRCYPSDFIVFSLSKYLLPAKISFVKFSNGSMSLPGLFTMTDELEVGNTNSEFYKGKVIIIVNEQTQSSAEYHSMAFRTAPKATVIGSTTAGADGNVSQFTLPGGISTMISGIGVYYPNGKETQRIGIVPDIEVKSSIKGIREGKDELLEKAIEIINAK